MTEQTPEPTVPGEPAQPSASTAEGPGWAPPPTAESGTTAATPQPAGQATTQSQPSWLLPVVAAAALALGLLGGFVTATVLNHSQDARFSVGVPGAGFRPDGDGDHQFAPPAGPGQGLTVPGSPGTNG